MARESCFPMIPMDTAWQLIQQELAKFPRNVEYMTEAYGQLVGRRLAEDVAVKHNVPPVACSRLDGYAVRIAEIECSKEYEVVLQHRAGHVSDFVELPPGSVGLVNTGAPLPTGADTVIPVEYCNAATSDGGSVSFHTKCAFGNGVRAAGADIAAGECIAVKGTVVDIGMLSAFLSAHIFKIPVYTAPSVGVMSSGDELVNILQAASLASLDADAVIDTNKPMLAHLITKHCANFVDLGAIKDDEDSTITALRAAVDREDIDILITTGGVSMGDRDYIKPALQKLGIVHFGRLLMKPGKPAIFASVEREGRKPCLVFGLPGNPVSAWVCFHVLVLPAIKHMLGAEWSECLPVKIPLLIQDSIPADAERPEFHRCIAWFDEKEGRILAASTGSQASSRLASTMQANVLAWIPVSTSPHPVPLAAQGYVIGELAFKKPLLRSGVTVGAPRGGCGCGAAGLSGPAINSGPALHPSLAHGSTTNTSALAVIACILTVSTSCSLGKAEDKSGPAIAAALHRLSPKVAITVSQTKIVPDDIIAIRETLVTWCDSGSSEGMPHLVITTGGTGMSATDVTPEAVQPLLWKRCPGLVHAMLTYSLTKTPLAALSRYDAGIIRSRAAPGGTLVLEFPGSVKAVMECLDAVKDVLPHALTLLRNDT